MPASVPWVPRIRNGSPCSGDGTTRASSSGPRGSSCSSLTGAACCPTGPAGSTRETDPGVALAMGVFVSGALQLGFQRHFGTSISEMLRDIRLAIRLGLSGTPAFLHEGNFVSGEPELFEAYAKEKVPAAPRGEPANRVSKPAAR